MSIQVTRDEADKKNELERILARRRRIERTQLDNPRGDRRYKFINSRSRSLSRARDQGLIPVDPENSEGVMARYGEIRDGAICLGEDLILCEEPMEYFEAKRAADLSMLANQIEATNTQVRENINKIARDEGRAPAHTDMTFDDSAEGAPVMVRKSKKST